MTNLLRRITLYFSAGAAGGLANALCVWFFGSAGITRSLDVAIAPSLTPEMLYTRIVWGGVWGLAFLLPLAVRSPAIRGLLCSLGPTFVQLFIVFPQHGRGMMGLELGTLTPAFVLVFNAAWGLTAALWLAVIGEN